MTNPKPQRERRRREKKVKVEVDIKNGGAGAKKKKPAPKNQAVVIKTDSGDREMRTRSANAREVKNLARRLKKLEKTEAGPKIQDVMATTLTLGPLWGNATDTLSKQHRVWLSPILLKPTNAGDAATPLTVRAAQYTLWKPMQVKVVVKPLVGNAMVTGTTILVDLDQEGASAKPDSIDSIKARPHKEVTVGSLLTWNVPKSQLVGPRDGWWLVDTNESPTLTLGPALNFSTYLTTFNLMSVGNAGEVKLTNHYPGTLALCELQIKYAFSNYNPRPALATLTAQEGHHDGTSQSAQFKNAEDGSLVMEVSNNSAFWKIMDEVETLASPSTDQKKGKGSTFWSVTSDVVQTVAPALGPWGWLLRGGWWVVRRLFGQTTRVGTIQYQVYASVEDAARDLPVYAPVKGAKEDGSTALPAGYYRIQQLNSDNLQHGAKTAQMTTRDVVVYGGDYLPLAYAPKPDTVPGLLYSYNKHDGYIRGIKDLLIPQWGNVDYLDCLFLVTGFGNWEYMASSGKNASGAIDDVLSIELYIGQATGKRTSIHIRGKYLNWIDFRETVCVLGLGNNKEYGMVHNHETLLETLKQFVERKDDGKPAYINTRDAAFPAQIAFAAGGWTANHESRWPYMLEDFSVFGVNTMVVPMKLMMGNDAVQIETQYGSDYNTWKESKADTALIISDTGAVGLLFATNLDPGTFNPGLIYAANCVNYNKWLDKRFHWHRTEHKDESKTSPPQDTDLDTDAEAEAEWEKIMRKRDTERDRHVRKKL